MFIGVIIIGWLSGAFVNYISDVLPYYRRLAHPVCHNCEKPQPYLNYLFWPRVCPYCQQRRSVRSWIVELLAVIIAIWLYMQSSLILGFWLSLVITIYFGVVVVIDLEHHLIMHPISLVGSFLGFGIGIQLHGITETILGGLAGFGSMLILYFLGALFSRYIVRRRREGFTDEALGFGDVILGGVLGLLLGWPVIIVGLFFAIILAGAGSLLYLMFTIVGKNYKAFTFIPYGPFMVAGAAALIFFGQYFRTTFGG